MGVTVTVRTCPVIVSSDITGVGDHVLDVSDDPVVGSGGSVVEDCKMSARNH